MLFFFTKLLLLKYPPIKVAEQKSANYVCVLEPAYISGFFQINTSFDPSFLPQQACVIPQLRIDFL